jgi:hypothetical protein
MKRYQAQLISVLVILVMISCSNSSSPNSKSDTSQAQTAYPIKEKTALLDTLIFKVASANEQSIKLLMLNDNGQLNIKDAGIVIDLKEGQDALYNLTVLQKGKIVFEGKSLQGISKVFYNKTDLLFAIYYSFSEDGGNEGEPIKINLIDQTVKRLGKKLNNTCNPISFGNNIYMVNNLELIKTNEDFIEKNRVVIKLDGQSNDYLDQYLICGLSKSVKNNNELHISFSPNKADVECKYYHGRLPVNEEILLLRN